jgi:histone-lysine N-methyltransferase SUV420H
MAIYSHLPSSHKKPARTKWRSTKVMKVQDLARDDDFLSHLLVEKLGTGDIPLLVHKMDASRRLPKTSPQDLMAIIRRVRFTFP